MNPNLRNVESVVISLGQVTIRCRWELVEWFKIHPDTVRSILDSEM